MDAKMMKNFFNTDVKTTILFSVWKTENALAILSESLKALRLTLMSKNNPVTAPNETTKLNTDNSPAKKRNSPFNLPHLLQTILYWIQVWIGIFSMLIYMTFNVYLCVSISLGNAVGYFILAWLSEKYANKDLEAKCC